MPLEPILVAASALGTLVVLATFVVRGREIGWELSGATAFVVYLRLASLVASVIVAFGLADILRAMLVVAPPSPGYTDMVSATARAQLIRGATFLACGAAFWTVHFFLRAPAVAGARDLYLAFVAVGATAFGVTTVVTLPYGLAEEVERLFRVGDLHRSNGTLGGGLAALVVWLAHLWQLRAQLGRGSSRPLSFGPPLPSAVPPEAR